MSVYESKYLKLVQQGYENYTGPIGPYEFEDGVSVEKIPLVQRNRLGAAFQMVEVSEDGTEVNASVAERILRDKPEFGDVAEPLNRQSDLDKFSENVSQAVGGEVIRKTYTKEALEKLADERGIAGVRLVAAVWGVKSKSIPELVGLILKAHSQYVNNRIESLVEKGAVKEEVEALFTPSDKVIVNDNGELVEGEVVSDSDEPREVKVPAEPISDEGEDDLGDDGNDDEFGDKGLDIPPVITVHDSAITGDFSAALNTEENDKQE